MFFSKVMEGLDFITLYVALSQGQVDSILGGGVAMPLKGLALGPTRKMPSIAVMILQNGNVSMWLVVVRVVRFSLTRILLSAHFECTPSGTSKRALEKCWFGRSQPSTGGEAEFNIKKS